MLHALRLAVRGNGRCWPNPAVGCVIVQGGRVVGRGVTQQGGRPHAERMALAQAGDAARGATVYVTLEPCAHHGHTPPCAEALIAAGVARVATALTDPDPRVAGRGHAMLRSAGIAVSEDVCADLARDVTAGFLKRITKGLPFVTLKMATSLDGRTALADGSSRWITQSLARRAVHALRLSHDAVLIGVGTALVDDPDLRAREIGARHQPVRVILDSRLRTPLTSRLAQSARQTPVWLLHTEAAPPQARAAWEQAGARLINLGQTTTAMAALRALAAEGLTRVLCEGGATLAASLLAANLVDELAFFTAGLAIGDTGHAGLGPLPMVPLAQATRFNLKELQRFGPDSLAIWALPPG